ncbi:hypothetical protein TGAM01_v202537 [Trichoderma gamsii]|uniref:2EXR domain-containing protein n=1 Tax=Trichoderma gamsii TaxID=398673 RepID=A0A2P4ZWM7_9HYPO|nr:hypothetical protein TGAM01_v202537 [Trichoderma gamsii]PON28690.1 hypothetical protein TGAM01_v202537 [Trichoderma gamsii]
MVNFSQLPYELREKIWLDTIEPRLVGLIPRRVGRGLWSVKSTARPPVALHINRESRHILNSHYQYLEARTVLNHKLASWPYEVWPIVLDSSPWILFNFDIDTLHFADTTPPDKPLPDTEAQKEMPKTPTNAMDLLILKESGTTFGPGFRAMLDANSRIQDWPYLLEAKDLSDDYVYGADPGLLNWTHIRYVRFDFNMFLSDLAIWWGIMHPFVKWMQQAAIHVETPSDPIRSCDLVMVSGRGNKRKLERTLRVALRPEQEFDPEYQSLSPIEQLEQYGVVVFGEVLPTPESKAILFEVVDPLIGNEAISKWKQFSINQRLSRPPGPLVLPRATPFGVDMEVLWQMAKLRRGLVHGEMSPVHGLCLADYGIDGGFRGRT